MWTKDKTRLKEYIETIFNDRPCVPPFKDYQISEKSSEITTEQ